MFDESKIKEFVKANTEECYGLLKDLCLIPAPSGKEKKRAEYCLNYLKSIGYDNAYIDGAKNVICLLGGEKNLTVVAAHTDTVFPDTEPMPYIEKDGKVFSPGVGDDTACVVDLLLCAKFFKTEGVNPENGILFVLNSCEEGLGNLKGTKELMKNYSDRVKQFVTLDSPFKQLVNACVGSHRYEVEVLTEGGHSFSNFGNTNAIAVLSSVVTEIYKIEVPKIEGTTTTYGVGIISGGTSVNTIAQNAKMLCEYRSDSVECLKFMQKKFEDIFENARKENKAEVNVRLVGNRPCAEKVDETYIQKLTEICKNTVTEVTGIEPKVVSGSTDCNIPMSLGIPSVCVGTYIGDGPHTREEWVQKDSVPNGAEVAIKVIDGILNLR